MKNTKSNANVIRYKKIQMHAHPQLTRYYSRVSKLEQFGNTIAEYIWIDGSGSTIRSKARTITNPVNSIKDIPDWNFDGSSCLQAETKNSEIILKPEYFCRDPFREGENIIVLCSTYKWKD